MMSHDCWSLIHLFMAQSVTIWLPLWCPPGRASRRDWRYPGFGRTATRSTTEALNFHWILDSETPQDTSSIPLRGRGRNPRIHHDTTIQKLSNCSMVDCQERVTPRGKIEVSQGKSRPADPPWLPNSCWPSSDANIDESNHNNNKNKNNNPTNPHNCNNHNNNHKYAAYYGHYRSYDYHCITTWLPRCPAKGGVDMPPPMPLMILGTGW